MSDTLGITTGNIDVFVVFVAKQIYKFYWVS